MLGYLDTLKEQSIRVVLNGQEIEIPRAHLGLHLKLSVIVDEFDNAPGSVELGQAIRDYFSLLGVDIDGASAAEMLRALVALRELNSQKWVLAFQKNAGPEPESKEAYDYPARNWAWLISKLASRFGWSKEEIFNLQVEEAFCYVQEILIAEHGEREFQYQLSELAYVYDSTTKRSFYREFARPPWMINTEMPKPVRILRSMLPYGVQDLNNNPVVYH